MPWVTSHVDLEVIACLVEPVLFILGSETTVLFILGSETTEVLHKLSNPSKGIIKLSMSPAPIEDPGYNVHQHLMFVIVCHVVWSQN